jgi:hypothetical protein
MTFYIHPTMSIIDLPPVAVVVCGEVDPSAQDMTLSIGEVEATKHRLCLVYAANVALTAHQRQQIATLVKKQDLRVAVMLGSSVTRGVVTALTWLTRQDHFRVFDLDSFSPALVHLGIAQSRHASYRTHIFDARKQMAAVVRNSA